MKYCAVGELVFIQDGNVLKVVRTLLNEEKHLAGHIRGYRNLKRINWCSIRLLYRESRIRGWGSTTEDPYYRDAERGCWIRKVFIIASVAGGSIIIYKLPKCSSKALRYKVRLGTVNIVQYYYIYFLGKAYATSENCWKSSTGASNTDAWNFGCCRMDWTASTACNLDLTWKMQRDTGSEIFGN